MNIKLHQPQAYNISFSSAPTQKTTHQNLSSKTLSRVDAIRELYKEIIDKIERLTPEGIKHIEEKLPVNLGRAISFNNIGVYGTSLVLRISNTVENDGTMRIIERKSETKGYGNRIVINSFVLDKQNRLLKNEDPNNVNAFWSKEEVLSKNEVNAQNLETSLNLTLFELEAAMKTLNKYIDKISSKYEKEPIGYLPAHIVSLVKLIPQENDKINKLISTIPKRLNMEARENYPHYKFTTATSVHSFQDLGEEGLTISFKPIESAVTDNLKRLYIYDKDGNVKDSFTIKDDSKMVTNINRKYIRKVIRHTKFATEEELQKEENLPLFEKYLNMYAERLMGLRTHIIDYVKNKTDAKTSAELPTSVQKNLDTIVETVNSVLEQLRYLPEDRSVKVKKTFEDLYSPPSRIGITFIEPNSNRMIHILPLKNHSIPNLVKLTITEQDGTEQKYVIKDNKYVLKNYNPQRPKVIPPRPIYMNSSDLEKIDIAKDLEFFKEKVFEYEEYVRKEFNDFIKRKTERKVKRKKDCI